MNVKRRRFIIAVVLFFLVVETLEEKEDEEKEQDKANRTARVQPTVQNRDANAESPNNPSADRRKYAAPTGGQIHH